MAWRSWLTLIAAALLASSAFAADLFVYPNGGQSQEQQQKDEYECYQFGKNNSGFDPMQAPTATSAKPADSRSTAGTTLRGAGLGAVVGAIADGKDGAGKGAAIGAASGLLFGGARSRDNREQQQQWEAQQQQQYQANRNNYNRAFAACMEGRNYTVR
jgi:hypothetical protein